MPVSQVALSPGATTRAGLAPRGRSITPAPAITRFGNAIATELSREAARGVNFLFVPVFLGAGALSYFLASLEPEMPMLAMLIACLAAGVAAVRSRYILHLALVAIMLFLVGVSLGKLEVWRADTKMLGSDVSTRITGRIVRIEDQASGRIRLTIDVTDTSRPELRYAPDRIRASARAVPIGLAAGDGITGVVRLMSPSGPVRPNGYDFSFESYFDGIGAVGFFLTNPQRVDLQEEPDPWSAFAADIENLRHALANRIRRHIPGAEGEIAAALVAGVRAGIPEKINEALRNAGLAHILSISGLHMALVAVTVMQVIRLGFALFPAFASRYPVKKFAAATALAASGFYLFISGNAVAAQRSFIMLAVMLVALLFDRAAITMRNLAIATIIVLAVSPHEIVGPSFQMSFAATLALIAAYAAWGERKTAESGQPPVTGSPLRTGLRRIALYGFGLAATSIIAGTATTLFAIWHFHRTAPLGLAGNLLAMPVVSTLVMPFGVLAAVLMPFGLEGVPLLVMGKGIAATIAIAQWVSSLAPNDPTGLLPAPAVLLLSAALIILCLATTRLRLLSLPLAILGAMIIWQRDLPDLMISEDSRLVGMPLPSGELAVNRDRPSSFTTDNWLSALASGSLMKPQKVEQSGTRNEMLKAPETGFACNEMFCIARHRSGAVTIHTKDKVLAGTFCNTATLIVVDDATARSVCWRDKATVITKRDLARRGSASVHFRESDGNLATEVHFSIIQPWRRWHEHRAYSRAARGLPPYQRKDRKKDIDTASIASSARISSGESGPPAVPGP